MKVGVNGLGGLGHMAVKLAKAFGAEVSSPRAVALLCLPTPARLRRRAVT